MGAGAGKRPNGERNLEGPTASVTAVARIFLRRGRPFVRGAESELTMYFYLFRGWAAAPP